MLNTKFPYAEKRVGRLLVSVQNYITWSDPGCEYNE
jgi:hypothetical protein